MTSFDNGRSITSDAGKTADTGEPRPAVEAVTRTFTTPSVHEIRPDTAR
jgi:hypothetical protein